jgi:glycosyltransferase involved in cell wall biosynthesis
MLTGRPIIASVDTDSDCADIIRATGCGMVVEPDNEEELRKAITTLAAMPSEELSKMGMTAFDYAKAHLSKETNLKIITDEITACTKTDSAGQAPQ